MAYEDRDDVREVDIKIRVSNAELRRLIAATRRQNTHLATAVRVLALKGAELDEQNSERQQAA